MADRGSERPCGRLLRAAAGVRGHQGVDRHKAAAYADQWRHTPGYPPSPPRCRSMTASRLLSPAPPAAAPLAVAQLRPLCRVRNATLYCRLAALCRHGILVKSPAGYRLASPPTATASRHP